MELYAKLLDTKNNLYRPQITLCTLLTFLPLNHSGGHFLFGLPPQKVKLHVIVQHRCTSPLLSLLPASPTLQGSVDSWLTGPTLVGSRHPSGPRSAPRPAGHLLLHRNNPPQSESTHNDTCDNKLSSFSLENKHF